MRPFRKATYFDNIQCKNKNSNAKKSFDHIDVFEIPTGKGINEI